MKNLKFNANEMLGRAELKTVFGGNGPVLGEGCPEDAPIECDCNDDGHVNCKETQEDCDYTCENT